MEKSEKKFITINLLPEKVVRCYFSKRDVYLKFYQRNAEVFLILEALMGEKTVHLTASDCYTSKIKKTRRGFLWQ